MAPSHNVTRFISTEGLQEYFAKFGEVIGAEIKMDALTGRSRYYDIYFMCYLFIICHTRASFIQRNLRSFAKPLIVQWVQRARFSQSNFTRGRISFSHLSVSLMTTGMMGDHFVFPSFRCESIRSALCGSFVIHAIRLYNTIGSLLQFPWARSPSYFKARQFPIRGNCISVALFTLTVCTHSVCEFFLQKLSSIYAVGYFGGIVFVDLACSILRGGKRPSFVPRTLWLSTSQTACFQFFFRGFGFVQFKDPESAELASDCFTL